MLRRLLIAVFVLVLAGGAFALGRSARAEPPEPDVRAKTISVEGIAAERWKLVETDLPSLAPPDPTPAPSPDSGTGGLPTATPPSGGSATTAPPPTPTTIPTTPPATPAATPTPDGPVEIFD